MSGIRLENKNEFLFPMMALLNAADGTPSATTTVRRQPTSAKDQDSFAMPFDGQLLAAVFVISTIGVAGDSVDLKIGYHVRDGGLDFFGSTVLTADAVAMDLNLAAGDPNRIPAAGRRIISHALSPMPVLPIGRILKLRHTQSGTLGTATRPFVTPVGIIVRATGSVDPRSSMYNR